MHFPGQAERKFALPLHFYSIQALKGLDEACTGKGTLLLSLPIQRLISFRNTLSDTPTNNVLPAL